MHDVVDVTYLGNLRVEIVFDNGKKGIVDLREYAEQGGIFNRLADEEYCKQVYVNKDIGTICWPEGQDIAPESLYSQVTGEPLSSWVEHEKQKEKKFVP